MICSAASQKAQRSVEEGERTGESKMRTTQGRESGESSRSKDRVCSEMLRSRFRLPYPSLDLRLLPFPPLP